MAQTNPTIHLSTKAFAELKKITLEEYGPGISDEEITDIGVRLLTLFNLLTRHDSKDEPAPVPKLSRAELQALKYIHSAICEHQKEPTVRQITQIIGKRSPRSGLRIIDNLIERDFVFRDGTGKLQVKSTVVSCDACSPGQKGTE